MARVLIQVPERARRGELIELRATIAHPMETGYRPGADGRPLPRDILRQFHCRYNGTLVFSAELHPSVSANPYLAFFLRASDSGTLEFEWRGDQGFVQLERRSLQVA